MTDSRQQKIQEMFEGFMSLQKTLNTRKGSFFQKYGLSHSQVHILYLIAHDNQLTIKEISTKMGITSSAATQMIEGLVILGFVERAHDQNDRRIVHVLFSTQGKKKFETLKKAHMERIANIFEVLDDREIEILIALPQKVLEKLKACEQQLDKNAE